MRKIGYARVSTKEQILERQLIALKNYGVPEEYLLAEKQSGKDFQNRPVFQSLKIGIGKLQAGDELVVTSIDRLSRNKAEAIAEIKYLKDNGIKLRVLDLPTTLAEIEGQDWVLEMINNILIEVLTSVAEQERLTTLERQKDGYAAMPIDPKTGKKVSLKTGKVVGRPAVSYPTGWEQVYASWKGGEITAVQAMQRLGLKKTSFYKLAKEYEEEQ